MFRRLLPLRCRFSTSTASSAAPTLYSNGTTSVSLLSWGRGASGQLGGGKEDGVMENRQSVKFRKIVKDVVEGQSHNLLESVAHRIARATLLKFLQISAVRVKVGKSHVAVQGIFDYLSVEILRYRKDMGGDSFCTPIICTE